jgi:hypothetical protein
MDEDYGVRSSLDFQIKEAKSRAELFSKSLHEARAQEAVALKLLEQERERWAHSFEEKSILIEQLERELTSTVEALDVERSQDKPVHSVPHTQRKVPSSTEIKTLADEDVHKSFHNMMGDIAHEIPLQTQIFRSSAPFPATFVNTARSSTTFDDNRAASSGVLRTAEPAQIPVPHAQHQWRAHAPQHNQAQPVYRPPLASTSAHGSHPYSEQQQTPSSVSSPKEDTSVWRDLLAQYQEQLKLTKVDLGRCLEDKDKLSRQAGHLEKQLRQLAEEKELFATACENAEGKLKFRAAQVGTLLPLFVAQSVTLDGQYYHFVFPFRSFNVKKTKMCSPSA